MKGRIAKLRRVQDLFTEGQLVVLEASGGDAEPFWVSKPTAFERDEAMKDGRAARARRALRFDQSEEEQQIVAAQLAEMTRDNILDTLVGAKSNEHYVKALDEVRADKAWAEHIEVIDRAGIDIDRDATDEDREVTRKITTDYMAEVDKRMRRLTDEHRSELDAKSNDQLREEYRKTWRDMTAFEAFMESRRVTEMYFAVRYCQATHEDGAWSHEDCDHRERLLESRDEVYDLPDALIERVRKALEDLQMSPREAGNSAAPATSSESSEQPNEVEDSTPSGPVETSPEPVGT